jgi:hypothetical protein
MARIYSQASVTLNAKTWYGFDAEYNFTYSIAVASSPCGILCNWAWYGNLFVGQGLFTYTNEPGWIFTSVYPGCAILSGGQQALCFQSQPF